MLTDLFGELWQEVRGISHKPRSESGGDGGQEMYGSDFWVHSSLSDCLASFQKLNDRHYCPISKLIPYTGDGERMTGTINASSTIRERARGLED
jgi:hypothetical protein